MDDPTKDTIPRSAVEYCLRKETVSTNPEKYKTHEKFIDYMNDPDISEFGHWMHSNGFNCALTAISVDLKKIPSVTPSSQTGCEDAVSRAEVLDEISNAFGLVDAGQRVFMLPTVTPKQPGWIPCSERLPDNNRQVLVYARSVHFVLAKYDEMREADGTYKMQWVTFDAWKPFYKIKEVIAWMPLPKPWKGGTG